MLINPEILYSLLALQEKPFVSFLLFLHFLPDTYRLCVQNIFFGLLSMKAAKVIKALFSCKGLFHCCDTTSANTKGCNNIMLHQQVPSKSSLSTWQSPSSGQHEFCTNAIQIIGSISYNNWPEMRYHSCIHNTAPAKWLQMLQEVERGVGVVEDRMKKWEVIQKGEWLGTWKFTFSGASKLEGMNLLFSPSGFWFACCVERSFVASGCLYCRMFEDILAIVQQQNRQWHTRRGLWSVHHKIYQSRLR